MERFRLLVDGHLKPSRNMAIDEALLRQVVAKESPPVLRFYQWDPPGLSLGRFQKALDGVDLKACSRHGVEMVRRLTGGEAVLHDDELTYSIMVPFTHPKFDGRGVVDTYKTISRALVEGLRSSGVMSTMAKDAPSRTDPEGQGVCFYTPTVFEIVARGKKIIGSAQTRNKLVILQHGSIPIDWDIEKQFDVVGIPLENRDYFKTMFQSRATTITEQLGKRPDTVELVKNFSEGFEKIFEMELQPSELTEKEKKIADFLERSKYGNDRWNMKI